MSEKESAESCKTRRAVLLGGGAIRYTSYNISYAILRSETDSFAEELTGRYRENRPGYPAIAISDVSHLSCVSNDFGYEYVFSRYVEAVGREGDVLLGISTSGNSGNIMKAIEAARAKGMKVITLTGKDGGKMAGSADVEIRVPHFGYADRIQEIHIKAIHILIQLIEKEMVK